MGESAGFLKATKIGYLSDGLIGILQEQLGTAFHLDGGNEHLGRLLGYLFKAPAERPFGHVHHRCYFGHTIVFVGEGSIYDNKQFS